MLQTAVAPSIDPGLLLVTSWVSCLERLTFNKHVPSAHQLLSAPIANHQLDGAPIFPYAEDGVSQKTE